MNKTINKKSFLIIRKTTFICLILGLVFMLLGLRMNFEVILHNNGKMPVFTNDFNDSFIHSDLHFRVNSSNVDGVKYLYLGDIYSLPNSIVSLGDIFQYLGVYFLFVSLLFAFYDFTLFLTKNVLLLLNNYVLPKLVLK